MTTSTLTPHPNTDILLAIADGKQLQYAITNGKWVDINSANVLRWISEENNEACSGIRVKPSTIRIGAYDVPEPTSVLENTTNTDCNTGCYVGCYYYTDSCFRGDCKTTNNFTKLDKQEVQCKPSH